MRWQTSLMFFLFFGTVLPGQVAVCQAIGVDGESSFDAFQTSFPEQETPVQRYKKGFFQQLEFRGGLLVPTSDDLSSRYLESRLSVAVPLGNFENIMVVSPSFRVDDLDVSLDFDVPNHLYIANTSFLWRKEWNDRWSSLLIFTPSVRTDFKSDDDGFRLFGLGLAQWEWVPDILQISFGAVYLGRQDLPTLLPAIGLVWTPTPQWKYDLLFPRPKISYQLWKEGSRAETWAYLSTDLGGNTWSVQRSDGTDDVLSIKDYRIQLGVERIIDGGGGLFFETGYAFRRRLEYATGGERTELSGAWIIQAGLRF